MTTPRVREILPAKVCDHGYWLADCALCVKLPGECDYGSCESPAVVRVPTVAHGRVCESRPMCAHHAKRAERAEYRPTIVRERDESICGACGSRIPNVIGGTLYNRFHAPHCQFQSS